MYEKYIAVNLTSYYGDEHPIEIVNFDPMPVLLSVEEAEAFAARILQLCQDHRQQREAA